MRKLFVGATFLLFGAGAASNAAAALALKGSDTLEDVARDVIAACPSAITAGITYLGGGSGGGEAAMIAATPTQQIAPMSRELATTTTPVACDGTKGAQELLIGLDGLAVVGANQLAGDSLEKTASTADDCGDAIVGGKSVACTPSVDGCDATGSYTFTDWRDVLAMVYAGQNHAVGALTISEAAGVVDPRYNPPTAVHKVRNPVRINCASLVRQNLVSSWGSLFADVGATSPLSCRTGTCVKLKHAFRRGDLSGTTDTFNNLVGLITVPGFTTTTSPTSTLFPGIDGSATANPFCNAGDSPMNKGDSDYLDLDPIRRIADSDSAANLRTGLEQVAEGGLRQALAERSDVGVDLIRGLGQAPAVGRKARLQHAQCAQLDQALREHAQLAGTVDRIGVVGGGDHLLRDLADTPVAVHRGGAQHGKSLLFGNLPRSHQDALGAIDELAFVETPRDLGELAAHAVLLLESRPRDMDHAAQPLHGVAVDDIGVDARLHGPIDPGRLRVVGEDDDRARTGFGEQRAGLEQRVVWRDLVADDDVGRELRSIAHQVAARSRTKHVNAGRGQIGGQVGSASRRFDDERGRHEESRQGRAMRFMPLTMQDVHHRARGRFE